MSYILDALRRADAERALGEVPTLHAPTAPWLDEPRREPEESGRAGRLRWTAAGGGLALGAALLGSLAWAFWPSGQDVETRAVASRVESAAPPASVVPFAASAAGPAALAAPAPGLSPATQAAPVVQPVTTPPASPPPVPPVTPPVAPPAAPPVAAPAKPVAPPARAAAAVRPSSPAPPPERPSRLEDLSPDQRRGLPPLAVSGAVYSSDPASRMLILNGQLAREGDILGPDLTLLRIEPRSAVLEHRGQRFTIGY